MTCLVHARIQLFQRCTSFEMSAVGTVWIIIGFSRLNQYYLHCQSIDTSKMGKPDKPKGYIFITHRYNHHRPRPKAFAIPGSSVLCRTFPRSPPHPARSALHQTPPSECKAWRFAGAVDRTGSLFLNERNMILVGGLNPSEKY